MPSAPSIDYDSLYINTEGEKTGGIFDMNKNRITNVLDPSKPLDVANKAYVDSMVAKVQKSAESSLSRNFKTAIGKVERSIKLNIDQDFALKNLLQEMQKQIDDDTHIQAIRSKLPNTKNISTLVVPWGQGYSMTKNIVLLQVLIELDNNCWLDIRTLWFAYLREVQQAEDEIRASYPSY